MTDQRENTTADTPRSPGFISRAKDFLKRIGFIYGGRPVLIFTDVDELYKNTLLFSQSIRPWAISEGKFKALELRYQFALAYLKDREHFNPAETEYYRFIEDYTRQGFRGVYDGNRRYAMTGADAICRRYLSLIDSIVKHLDIYNSLTPHTIAEAFEPLYDDIIAFERANKRQVYYIRERKYGVQRQSQEYDQEQGRLKSSMGRNLSGRLVPSAVRWRGSLVVKNGSHRLAAFKALKDLGRFTNAFPVFVEE